MHQNNLLRDIFVFTNTMRLYFCISDGDRQAIIVIRVFFIFILPLLMELFFSVDKIPLVSTMTLHFKAAVNMEDKHTLNLDKFHVCIKLLLSCPGIYLRNQLAWTKLLSIKLSCFHIFTFQLPFLVCHRK